MTRNSMKFALQAALLMAGAALIFVNGTSTARAEDAKNLKAESPKAAAPDAGAVEAVAPPAEPDRISGKIHKVDPEGKSITVICAPERGTSGRAFRRYKLMLDDKSLILINQQPSTLSALEAGQNVEVGYFKKGKQEVVDTVVVTGKDE